jgi:hypothetical protein
MKSYHTLTALLLFAAVRTPPLLPIPFFCRRKRTTRFMKIWLGKLATGAGIYFFTGRTLIPALRRGLIAFDLNSIPANATITGVNPSMFLSMSHGDPAAVSLSKVLRKLG